MYEKTIDKKDPLAFITSFMKKFLKWIMSLLVLLLVWTISLVLCLGIIIYFGQAWDLAHNGLTAQGSIMRIDSCQLSSGSNNQPQQYGWRPYVQFKDINGNTYEGEGYGTICHHMYEPFSSTIPVHYLAQDPAFFTPEPADSPLISSFLYGIICSLWMLALTFILTPVWLWVTFSPRGKRVENKVSSDERLTKIGNFSASNQYAQALVYQLDEGYWWLSFLTEEGKFIWDNVGNTSGFGNLQDGRPLWVGNFSNPNGCSQMLLYSPGDHNWWLSALTEEDQFIWHNVGNTSGFGNLQDGRPFWMGNFSDPNGYTQMLFYSPSDQNWWLSTLTEEGKFIWDNVGNTSGFGNLQDGRPLWVGNFSDPNGCTQMLFYSPCDHNWRLSTLTEEGKFTWDNVATF